jgi:hypothetical protein
MPLDRHTTLALWGAVLEDAEAFTFQQFVLVKDAGAVGAICRPAPTSQSSAAFSSSRTFSPSLIGANAMPRAPLKTKTPGCLCQFPGLIE